MACSMRTRKPLHRDLKPSNILVGEVDGKPAPRIIDFGVAKATAQRLTADTMFTQFGAIVGTPGYMSPEQADSAGADVDTRTDVYSLGVVLYQLLVGVLPLDFSTTSPDQFPRRLRDEDAARPSTRLRTLGAQTGMTAQNRGADAPTLARQLRGDLDAITLKALEKDRSRRYATPSELAADIGRYLRNEPVLARPASAGYRGTRSGFAAAKGARIGKPYCRRSYWSCSAPTGGGSGQKTGYSPATSPDNPSAAHPSSGRESPHHSGESRNYAPQNRLKTIAKRGPSPDPTKTACYSYVGQRDIRTARNGSPHSPQGVLSGTPSFFDNFNRGQAIPNEVFARLTQLFLDTNTARMPERLERGLVALFSTIQVSGIRITLGEPPLHPDMDWARVHLLAVDPEYYGNLRVLTYNLRKGVDEDAAFRNAFGKSPEQIELQAQLHLAEGRFQATSISPLPMSPQDFPERSVEPAAAQLALADLLLGDRSRTIYREL